MKTVKFFLIAILLFVLSCAGHYDPYFRSLNDVKIDAPFKVLHSETGVEVEEVLEKAYGDDFSYTELHNMVQAALKKYPRNGALHEVAAFLALLDSNNRKTVEHLIMAIADTASEHTETYLRIIDTIELTYHESLLLIKLLEEISRVHDSPRIRQVSRSMLAERYLSHGELDKNIEVSKLNKPVEKWKIIGSFDNDNGKGFYEKYPPEHNINFNEKYRGKVVEVEWREMKGIDRLGRIPLGDFLYPHLDTAAYLYTAIESDLKKEVFISISTADAIKMWLNGKEILAVNDTSRFSWENILVKAVLEKGMNALLIKTARSDSDWNTSIKIVEENGEPLNERSFSFSLTEQPGNDDFEVIFPFTKKPDERVETRDGILKGLLLQSAGFSKYARDYYYAVFDSNPRNLFSKLFTAESFLVAKEEGKYIDLISLAILKTGSEVPAFVLRRGEFFSMKNQQDRAEDDFRKVLEQNPFSMRAHINLAALYMRKGWHEDSRRVWSAALEKWPDSPILLIQMASTLERMGYIEDAALHISRALKLFPGSTDLHLRSGDFSRRKNDRESALKWGEKALSYEPFNRTIYFRLHELARQMKDYNLAFEYLDKIESFSPDNAMLHRKRGDLYYERGLVEKAVESWEKSHLLNPADTYLSERINFMKVEKSDITNSFVPTEEQLIEAIKKSKDFVPHEGAEALMIYDHAVARINSDGSSRWVVTEVNQALNDTGRDNLINIFLPYGGRKKILNAYSLDSNFRKSEASSVSSYDVRFRQLKTGDYTVVQYIHYNPAPLYLENNFVGQWFVRTPSHHIIYNEWNLIYPEGKEINIDIASKRVTETKKKIENGLIVHTFKAENIEPLIHEYYSPPISDYIDIISVSTVKSWDQYVSWERALLRDAFVRSTEIRKKHEKLTSGKESVMDKINAIFSFVAQEIRYQQEYENVIAGVKPHTAAQTLERGYGDCKDKAVLFIQLLEEAGIKAKYTIIRTTDAGKLLKKIPGQQFNHAIVYIPEQKGIEEGFFMDPTVDLLEIGNLRSDNQGATALILDHRTGEYKFKEVPYQSPELNFQKHERTLKLDDTGRLVIEDSIQLRGSLSSMLRQVLRTKEVAFNMFQNLASSLYKGGVLKNYETTDINDIKKPLTVKVTADVNSLKTVQNDRITISLPDQIINPDLVSIENRKLPLSTGVPAIYEVNTVIAIPRGMKVESIPEPISVKGDCFNIVRTSEIVDDTVIVKFRFKKECTIISVEDYPAYREKMLQVIKVQNALIVFSK